MLKPGDRVIFVDPTEIYLVASSFVSPYSGEILYILYKATDHPGDDIYIVRTFNQIMDAEIQRAV